VLSGILTSCIVGQSGNIQPPSARRKVEAAGFHETSINFYQNAWLFKSFMIKGKAGLNILA
jgi:hypothetical protein